MNIYSANIMEADTGMFDLSQRFGKQLLWIGASLLLAMLLLVLDAKFYIYFSYFLYALLIADPPGGSGVRKGDQWCKKLVCYRRIPASTF